MATDRLNRAILRTLSERPVQWSPTQQAQLAPAGREGMFVGAIAEGWMKKAPDGGVDPDSEQADEASAALIDGWSSTIVQRLAAGPLTLTEIGLALDTISSEDVAAKVATMEEAGLVEERPRAGEGEGAVYAATEWLRLATAPLAAAVRCERRHAAAETPPLEPLDVEALFLLPLPLLRMPPRFAGRCRLVVELPESDGRPAAGAIATVADERIVLCTSELEGEVEASATGTALAWFEAIIEGMAEDLEFGGEEELARELVEALNRRLFRS
jgi:DNA-binding HxlR family transcriptional regulator